VRLYHPGKQAFQHVEVDDRVPMRGSSAAYASPSLDGEVWVPLLEKAFAKMCGGYANMSSGSVLYGMLYLCGGGDAEAWHRGAPREGWRRSYTKWTGRASDIVVRENAEGVEDDGVEASDDELWALMRTYMERCYVTACRFGTRRGDACGLKSGRYYSLLGAREVKVGRRTLRILFMRNPFGIGEWEGRWSDDSDSWRNCAAARNQLHFSPEPDGTFWISFNDFLQYFDRMDCVTKSMPCQGSHRIKHVGLRRGLQLAGKLWD